MPQHHLNGPAAIAKRLLRQVARRRAQRHQQPRPLAAAAPPEPVWLDRIPLSTVEATIAREGRDGYSRLVWSDGEPHLLRNDFGLEVVGDREQKRRSLLYFAQHTDAHLCDAQATSRLEPGERFAWFDPGADGGHRPQETCTAHVFDQIVRATNAVTTSPLTGAAMASCVQTGDNTDNRTRSEGRWFVDVLDGREVTPNSGAPDRYEGVQRSGVGWSFQPDDPSNDTYGRAGFPRLPGFLDASIKPFQPVGLDVPWLAVLGNHDVTFIGTFGPHPWIRFDRYDELLRATTHKPAGVWSLIAALAYVTFLGSDPRRWDHGLRFGRTVNVTADLPAREPLSLNDFFNLLGVDTDDSATGPGAVGHGFTATNRADGTAWWSRPEGERIQFIGLDTCNHTNGSEGALDDRQFRWLEAELIAHSSRWLDEAGRWQSGDTSDERLFVIFSHHNSWTMTNKQADAGFPGARHLGPELVKLLHRFPNVLLWVNGHSHEHAIVAHAPHDPDTGGFWEVNTASCVDFGQQARTIEILDNYDGTLSIFTTVLDHVAPPSIDLPDQDAWTPQSIASISRELAANDAIWFDPFALLGEATDRNTELLIAAPNSLGRHR